MTRRRQRKSRPCTFNGLGRPIARTCDDADKVTIPSHRRCRPPKRVLPTVQAGASTPAAHKATVQAAEKIEKAAKREAQIAADDAKEAARVAREAAVQVETAKREQSRTVTNRAQTPRATSPRSFTTSARGGRLAPRAGRTTAVEKLEQKLRQSGAQGGDVGTRIPTNPCTGERYRDFVPPMGLTKPMGWRAELLLCRDQSASRRRERAVLRHDIRAAEEGVEGLAGRTAFSRLSRKEQIALKDRLIGPGVDVRPPTIESIDTWALDVDPCDGMTYARFKSGFTRSDAYWAATHTQTKTGEKGHGPSKRKTNASHAKLKRLVWQEKLHACAMKVWLNRARVSKDAAVQRAYRRWKSEHDETSFDPEFLGLGRTRPKGTPRCHKAPKKLTKGCTEEAFRKNMRHLICVGEKEPAQAKAIALSTLRTACGGKRPKKGAKSTTKPKGGLVKSIVAAGKRKKGRKG